MPPHVWNRKYTTFIVQSCKKNLECESKWALGLTVYMTLRIEDDAKWPTEGRVNGVQNGRKSLGTNDPASSTNIWWGRVMCVCEQGKKVPLHKRNVKDMPTKCDVWTLRQGENTQKGPSWFWGVTVTRAEGDTGPVVVFRWCICWRYKPNNRATMWFLGTASTDTRQPQTQRSRREKKRNFTLLTIAEVG